MYPGYPGGGGTSGTEQMGTCTDPAAFLMVREGLITGDIDREGSVS